MNSHVIVGWIPQYSDGSERHYYKCLSTSLLRILNLTLMTNQERCSFLNKTELKIPSQVHLLHQWVLFYPLACQVRHLKWCQSKYCANHMDIFDMYVEMSNDKCTEMQQKLQHSRNSTVCITTPTVGGTGPNLVGVCNAVITQKLWILKEPHQAFAQVLWLGHHGIPTT